MKKLETYTTEESNLLQKMSEECCNVCYKKRKSTCMAFFCKDDKFDLKSDRCAICLEYTGRCSHFETDYTR